MAPALALFLLLAADPPPADAAAALKTAQDTYAQAQGVYQASCGARAYAAYDDICEQLARQLRTYAAEVDRLSRRAEDEKARARRP